MAAAAAGGSAALLAAGGYLVRWWIQRANVEAEGEESDDDEGDGGALQRLQRAARKAYDLTPDERLTMEARISGTWVQLRSDAHAAEALAGGATELRARTDDGETMAILGAKGKQPVGGSRPQAHSPQKARGPAEPQPAPLRPQPGPPLRPQSRAAGMGYRPAAPQPAAPPRPSHDEDDEDSEEQTAARSWWPDGLPRPELPAFLSRISPPPLSLPKIPGGGVAAARVAAAVVGVVALVAIVVYFARRKQRSELTDVAAALGSQPAGAPVLPSFSVPSWVSGAAALCGAVAVAAFGGFMVRRFISELQVADVGVEDDDDEEDEADGSLQRLRRAARKAADLPPEAPVTIEARAKGRGWERLQSSKQATRVIAAGGSTLELRAVLPNGDTVTLAAPPPTPRPPAAAPPRPSAPQQPQQPQQQGQQRTFRDPAAMRRNMAHAMASRSTPPKPPAPVPAKCKKGHKLDDADCSDDDSYCDHCNTGLIEGSKTHACRACQYAICTRCFNSLSSQPAVGDKSKDGRRVSFLHNGRFFGMLNTTDVLQWPSQDMKAMAGQSAWGDWRPAVNSTGTIAHYWLRNDFKPLPPLHRRSHLSWTLCIVRVEHHEGDRFVVVSADGLEPADGDKRPLEFPRDGDRAQAPAPTLDELRDHAQQRKAQESSSSDDDGEIVWAGKRVRPPAPAPAPAPAPSAASATSPGPSSSAKAPRGAEAARAAAAAGCDGSAPAEDELD
eukprot:TRINITY_DN1934_c0_g1_i1.p1 TRINITY_DN1934_c0_g1~~TRINITY_DN1934_c0_g1_i1.p1  ORF type:complete len:728 (+),score=147.25 TRINITY_DN1934_c0_g1_i1:81-2264(+)